MAEAPVAKATARKTAGGRAEVSADARRTVQVLWVQKAHRPSGVALHVVGGLVEVPDPWNVVLPALAQHAPRVVDHHRRVPDRVSVVLGCIFCNNIDCLSLL